MELEYDKEIDAILRNPRVGHATPAAATPHVDADALAAFTENALPAAARLLYIEHVADCDRCRKMLASTISMNPEAAEIPYSIPAVAVVREAPWYRAIFTARAWATALGILVLGFTGIIFYQLSQRPQNESGATVSQINEPEPERGAPFAADESQGSVNSNMSAAVTSGDKKAAAANSTPNASIQQPITGASSDRAMPGGQTPPAEERAVSTADSVSITQSEVSGLARVEPRPPAAPKASITLDGTDLTERKAQDDREKGDSSGSLLAKRKNSDRARSGPLQNQARQMNNQQYDMSVTRSVGGKTFTNRDGAWYDSAYRSQQTANFRRGTAEYKKLDSGLRSIADTLGGTVVVVWKEKAYRIQ